MTSNNNSSVIVSVSILRGIVVGALGSYFISRRLAEKQSSSEKISNKDTRRSNDSEAPAPAPSLKKEPSNKPGLQKKTFYNIFLSSNAKFTDTILNELWDKYDSDKDGDLSVHEVQALMTGLVEEMREEQGNH